LNHGLLSDLAGISADWTRSVSAVTCDSRSAVPGGLFICKGAAFKQEYLESALMGGCFCYISETRYPVSAPCILVTDVRRAMGRIADLAWGHPSGQLRIVGITGTKGKTTTAYFLQSALNVWRAAQGLPPAGLLSSIIIDDGFTCGPATLTTPEPLDLQRHLFHAVNAGCDYLVMEVSSQALKYDRVFGVELDTAVFLNIGEDHISPREHQDFNDYFSSKLTIFAQSKNAVVNLDSDYLGEIVEAAKSCQHIINYSLYDQQANYYVANPYRTRTGVAFLLDGRRYLLPMPGLFNVSNALAAIAAGKLLGIPDEYLIRGLREVRVPGRMETYCNAGKIVVVDYAHNGMALKALLCSVRNDFPDSPVTVVFGCVGGKALDRRRGMGMAAGKYADRIILTEDDPGPEEVEAICAEIGRYVQIAGGTYEVIPDRNEAVREAILRAEGNRPVIVLAGKGAESAQKRKNGPVICVPDAMLAKKYLGLPLGQASDNGSRSVSPPRSMVSARLESEMKTRGVS